LIFRKISKFDANRCKILRLKCTKFDFRRGSAPDPAVGAYRPLAVAYLRGPTSNERAGRREREGEMKRMGEVRGEERMEGEGPGPQIF